MDNTRKVKVLLVADPPMGDKVAAKLRDWPVVDLVYVRGKHAASVPAIPKGTAWVLAMNAGTAGVAIKEAARQAGARFLPIPPSWSAAHMVLEEDGFFDRLRGLSDLDDVSTGGDVSLDVGQAFRVVAAAALKKMEGKPGPVIEAASVPPDAPRAPRCDGPPKVVGVKRRDPVEVAVQPVKAVAAAAPSSAEPQRASGSTDATRDARRVAGLRLAAQMFQANPEVSGTEVMNALRELLGVGINSPDLYRIRREVRAAAGLDPSGGTRNTHRSTLALGRSLARQNGVPAAQVPPFAAPATPAGLAPQATGVLGMESQAAIDLLCATLPRDGVRGLVVTFDANGAPHVEVELAVVRTETVAYTPKGSP